MVKIKILIETIKFKIAYILGKFYKNDKRKIYLIGERVAQCQDNGYHLFKYIRENYKDEEIYYCISKKSKDIEKVKAFKNVIYDKSFKHFFYYVIADKLICAHVGSCTPDIPAVWKASEKGVLRKKKIFIQHGITKELIPSLMYKNTKFHKFVCGAKKEYEFVSENFGYRKKRVRYLGLCRFDNLSSFKEKNIILVMPTWRQWFGMDNQGEVGKEEFRKSKYYKKYDELINDEKVIQIIKENNLKLIFYPHNEMQRYVDLFKAYSENVIIAKKEDYEVQELLKEAKVLITDYSSIAFDFAYMRKPLIYYQFDEEEYFEKHYVKGYFNYYRDGFGKVIKEIDDLNEEITTILKRGIEKKYKEREIEFFPLADNENCERHYREIIKED